MSTFYEDLYKARAPHEVPYTTRAETPHQEALRFPCPLCAQPATELCITYFGRVTDPQWIPDRHTTCHKERHDLRRADDARLRGEVFVPAPYKHPYLVPRRPDLLAPGTKFPYRIREALSRVAQGLPAYPMRQVA